MTHSVPGCSHAWINKFAAIDAEIGAPCEAGRNLKRMNLRVTEGESETLESDGTSLPESMPVLQVI